MGRKINLIAIICLLPLISLAQIGLRKTDTTLVATLEGQIQSWKTWQSTKSLIDAKAPLFGGSGYIQSSPLSPQPSSIKLADAQTIRLGALSTGVGKITIAGNYTEMNKHSFDDYSVINSTTTQNLGYGIFDASTTISGTTNNAHFMGFQARQIYSGSGIMGTGASGIGIAGLYYYPTHSGTGNLTSSVGVYLNDIQGNGPVTSSYGLWIQDLTRGSAVNYAIYTGLGKIRFGDSMQGTIAGFTGSVTANTFVKTGGTLQQLLGASGTSISAGSNLFIDAGLVGLVTNPVIASLTTNGTHVNRGANTPALTDLFRVNGSLTTPTKVLNGDIVGDLRFGGQYGTLGSETTPGAQIYGKADGDYTGTSSKPTSLYFETAPSGGIMTKRMSINSTGGVSLYNTLSGTAGTDSVLVKNSTNSEIRKIAANYYAPVNSPGLTGTPTAPTAIPGTNTTQIATTAYVANNYAAISGATFTGVVSSTGFLKTGATATNILRANGTDIDFNSTTRGVVLTGLTNSNTPIIATDNVLAAFGKTQGQLNQLNGSGSTPAVTLGPGSVVGTGATISIVGNNVDGIITLVTGTGLSSGGSAFTFTAGSGFSYPTSCAPILQINTSASSSNTTLSVGSQTSNSWSTYSGFVSGSSLSPSTTYKWNYHNGGY